VRKLIISKVSQLHCYPNQLMVAKITALALVIGVVAGVIVLIIVVVLIAFPTPPRMRKQEKSAKNHCSRCRIADNI